MFEYLKWLFVPIDRVSLLVDGHFVLYKKIWSLFIQYLSALLCFGNYWTIDTGISNGRLSR